MFTEIFVESKKELIIEGVSKNWSKILKNIKNIKETNYTNNKGLLDLGWYGECNGCVNYGMTSKGQLYKIKGEDWSFMTGFQNDSSLKVTYYDSDNEWMDSEVIKFNPLTKMMKKVGSWKGTPIYINDKKTSKFSHFQKDTQYKNSYNFVFADDMKISVTLYNSDEGPQRRATIDAKIAEIESWGYKIARKIKPDLERLLPELYRPQGGFVYDKTVWMNAAKISKDPYFTSFINSMDKESRTGHYIELYSDEIRVRGLVGNLSSGYEGETYKFKKQPKTFAEFKKFFVSSGALDYTIDLQMRMSGANQSYMDYMRNGGAVD